MDLSVSCYKSRGILYPAAFVRAAGNFIFGGTCGIQDRSCFGAKSRCPDIPGVQEQCEHFAGIDISRIRVETQEAAQKLGKPVGNYVTFTLPKEFIADPRCREAGAKRLAGELDALLPSGPVLLAGLGNRKITPDALGPRTAEGIVVTRHLQDHCKEVLGHEVRSVAAFPTGVMGVTGIETVEAVGAMVKALSPAALIAVDALAALDSSHIGAMVQLNDTGISPGAGVGNFQKGLNRETLGVPVLALGIPLVLSAEAILESGLRRTGNGYLAQNLQTLLEEDFLSMVVTPKDIDAMVKDGARLLSQGLNLAFFGENYGPLCAMLP